jgi:hypothetical protein
MPFEFQLRFDYFSPAVNEPPDYASFASQLRAFSEFSEH